MAISESTIWKPEIKFNPQDAPQVYRRIAPLLAELTAELTQLPGQIVPRDNQIWDTYFQLRSATHPQVRTICRHYGLGFHTPRHYRTYDEAVQLADARRNRNPQESFYTIFCPGELTPWAMANGMWCLQDSRNDPLTFRVAVITRTYFERLIALLTNFLANPTGYLATNPPPHPVILVPTAGQDGNSPAENDPEWEAVNRRYSEILAQVDFDQYLHHNK